MTNCKGFWAEYKAFLFKVLLSALCLSLILPPCANSQQAEERHFSGGGNKSSESEAAYPHEAGALFSTFSTNSPAQVAGFSANKPYSSVIRPVEEKTFDSDDAGGNHTSEPKTHQPPHQPGRFNPTRRIAADQEVAFPVDI